MESAPVSLQLELIDLQSNTVLKDLFNPGINIFQFFKSLNQDMFPNLKGFVKEMLVMFASTYVREQTFSVMKKSKSDLSSRMTDEHLAAVPRIATSKMQPDFDRLVSDFKQLHVSH